MTNKLELDPRLQNVDGFVEANSFEVLCLYRECHQEDGLPWVQDTRGFCINVNPKVNDRPINLCFSFNKVNGKNIVFYDVISQLVDWAVIEKWFKDNFPKVRKTDAMNFRNILRD